MMTDDEIRDQLAICDAATPGPWLRDGRCTYVLGEDGCNQFWATPQTSGGRITGAEMDANAAFIAAARTGWPAALKALQEAKRDGHAARGRVDAREHRIAELENNVAEARDVAEQAVASRAVRLGANSVILVYAGSGPITAAEQLAKLADRIAELEALRPRQGEGGR